jgi:C-terminal processing protease CtpA/Prc
MGRNAIATGLANTQGKMGVGLIFRKDPYGLLHVLTIAKGSPAEVGGVISKGDVLMNINGHPAVGMSLAQVERERERERERESELSLALSLSLSLRVGGHMLRVCDIGMSLAQVKSIIAPT